MSNSTKVNQYCPPDKILKILGKEIKDFVKKQAKDKNHFPNINIAIKDDDLSTIYVKITDLDDEFKDGEYLIELKPCINQKSNYTTSTYPFTPPAFKFLTPNGVCEHNAPVCNELSVYHSENYKATLGIAGFSQQLMSSIVNYKDLVNGIGVIYHKYSSEKRKQIAKDSKVFNRENNADIIALFED